MRKVLTLSLLLVATNILSQQQFPPQTKWRTIETRNFQVVFPEEAASSAQNAINYLESSKYQVETPLNVNSKKIPVLLNNKSVISNGFVQLAPRYMSWYLTPPQDIASSLDGTDWMHLLSLHEQRHVGQFDKLDENFTDVLSDIAGDFGKAIGINISTPIWYFEGDAVFSETINSYSGRGRLPSFVRDNYALEEQNTRFSYNKALFGSYKDYTTDHYKLGYLLVDHVNRNYGEQAWVKVLERTSKHSYSPFSFSKSLKAVTGNNLSNTYQNALNEYDSIWKSKFISQENLQYKILTNQDKASGKTNYTYPYFIDDERIVAVKHGFSDNPTLVIIKNGLEEALKEINAIDRVHSNGNNVVWSQQFNQIRWGQLLYSDIMSFNIKTKKTKRITRKQKLFAPAISPDGKKIAAIEFTEDSKCSILILNSKNGNIIKRFTLNSNELARMPSWNETSDKIVYTHTEYQNREIRVISAESGKIIYNRSFGNENISNPVFFGSFILFNAPLNGKDQIHAINFINNDRFLAINSRFGVYNPQISGTGGIVFQDYDNTGYKICASLLDTGNFKKIRNENIEQVNYLYKLTPISKNAILPEKVSDSVYSTKAYSPLLNSFFFHSWHPTFGYRKVGLKAYSNDLLNNMPLQVGLDYYPRDAAHREYFGLSYARFFPVLSVLFSHGKKFEASDDTNIADYFDIDENLVDLRLSFPLNLSGGMYSRSVTLSTGLITGYQHNNTLEDSIDYISHFTTSMPFAMAQFVNHKKMRYRDLYPRFGQELDFIFIHSTSKSTLNDKKLILKGTCYLPGLFNHQSFRINAGFEMKKDYSVKSLYLKDYELQTVRGYEDILNFQKFARYTFDYSFPLLYPDLNLGAFLYIKRVHSSVYYDLGVYEYLNIRNKPSSIGIDLNFEFHLFRLPAPFEMGIRYAYRLEDNQNRFEILLFRLPV